MALHDIQAKIRARKHINWIIAMPLMNSHRNSASLHDAQAFYKFTKGRQKTACKKLFHP